jgi:hypothetical protein
MTDKKDNFKTWFREPLETLFPKEHAGFPIMMITLPLLERYLRSKSNIYEAPSLSEPFYIEFKRMFPVFNSHLDSEKRFWQVFRHGIMHQATLSLKINSNISMPGYGWLSGDVNVLEIKNGDIWVNPVGFSKHVLETIEKDFANFESVGASLHPLPTGKSSPDGSYGTSGHAGKSTP